MSNSEYNKKWIEAFCGGLSAAQIMKAGIGQDGGFLWHAFSYNFVPCLKGDDARKAYNGMDKSGAKQSFYTIDPINKKFSISNAEPIADEFMTAKQIDESDEVEVYIVGKDYQWCYVRTHESLCGPYFCYVGNKLR